MTDSVGVDFSAVSIGYPSAIDYSKRPAKNDGGKNDGGKNDGGPKNDFDASIE